MRDNCFSVQDICFQSISLKHITFPPNQSAGYFFPQITHNPPSPHPTQKSNGRKPTCSPALPKQRLLLVLGCILQIFHYKSVALLITYLALSYFIY